MASCYICLRELEKYQLTKDSYHRKCLRSLFSTEKITTTLSFTKRELDMEISPHITNRMSISGAQPKVSLKIEGSQLVPVNLHGQYILKPTPEKFPELSANEHLSMIMAKECSIEIPPLGLIKFSDGELSYIIKRFDRADSSKIPQEDLAQTFNIHRDRTGEFKYTKSYEEAIDKVIHSTGGQLIQGLRLFERIIFNFLIQNGDFHLKNISLVGPIDKNGTYNKISPLYDSLNTRIYFKDEAELAIDLLKEEFYTDSFLALGYYTRNDFMQLARRTGLNEQAASRCIDSFTKRSETLHEIIDRSFLSESKKELYHKHLYERFKKLSRNITS